MQFKIVVLILISCVAEKKQSFNAKELIGIWQDSPEVASGWSDTYQFFDTGKFIYRFNQMICDKRTLDYSGTWEVSEKQLKLTITEKTVLEGGKLVLSMGSCASEYDIEGGEIRTLKDIRSRVIQLSTILVDKENRNYKTLTLDGKGFWKLRDDPTQY